MSDSAPSHDAPKYKRHPARHLVLFFMRVILGGLFAFAAWGKIFSPFAFRDAIAAFEILPANWCLTAAVILIWHELVCGTFMLLGLWTRAATILMSGMLLTFLFGVTSAVIRGIEISCGCFGSFAETDVGWSALLRISVLLLFSLLLLYFGSWKWSLDLVIKVNRRIKAGLPGWRED